MLTTLLSQLGAELTQCIQRKGEDFPAKVEALDVKTGGIIKLPMLTSDEEKQEELSKVTRCNDQCIADTQKSFEDACRLAGDPMLEDSMMTEDKMRHVVRHL